MPVVATEDRGAVPPVILKRPEKREPEFTGRMC